MNKKKLILQVIVVALIAIVLIAIYFAKNPIAKEDVSSSGDIPSRAISVPSGVETVATTVDLIDGSENSAVEEVQPQVIDLLSTEFDVVSLDMERYISYGLPIMIDFYGETCPPCKAMEEDLNRFYAETQGKVTVRKLDAWEYPKSASDYPVMVVPTQIFFTSDGKPYMPSDEVLAKVPLYLYSWKESGELAFTTHQGMLTYDEMVLIFKDIGVEV